MRRKPGPIGAGSRSGALNRLAGQYSRALPGRLCLSCQPGCRHDGSDGRYAPDYRPDREAA
jgi:hypothetical protein